MSLEKMKIDFIRREFLTLSINGAFQHNHVYEAQVSQDQKTVLKEEIYEELNKIVTEYNQSDINIDCETHITKIEGFRTWLEGKTEIIRPEKHGEDGATFGTAQKLLNLYLKYMWCLGILNKIPPHCPLDSIILQKTLGLKERWKKMSKGQYDVITKKMPNIEKIAEWELMEWEEYRNKQYNKSKKNLSNKQQ